MMTTEEERDYADADATRHDWHDAYAANVARRRGCPGPT